jgi:integrase
VARSTSIPSYRRKTFGNREIAVVTLSDRWTRRRRDVWLGRWGSEASRQKYLRVLAEWESSGRRLDDHPATEPGAMTIAELCHAYREAAIVAYSASEVASVDKVIRLLLDYSGATPAAAFGPKALRMIRSAMIDGRKREDGHWVRRPWSRSHINRQVHRVRRIFKWAASHELLAVSIYEALRTVEPLRRGRTAARESAPITCAPAEAIEAAKRYVSRQVAAMIDLQLLTGMRPGEVTSLRPCDIDAGGKVWLYRPIQHKGTWQDRGRTIYLGPRAQDVLAPFLGRRIDAYCFCPAEADNERRDVLHALRITPMNQGNKPGTHCATEPERQPGERYSVKSYGRSIARACSQADRYAKEAAKEASVTIAAGSRLVAHWHPHQLRHNYATNVRREFGLEAAAILLGHASATVTDAVYAQRDEGKALAIVEKVG